MLFPITFLAALTTIVTPILGHPIPFTQDQTPVNTLVSRHPHNDDVSFISTSERRDMGVIFNSNSHLLGRATDIGTMTDDFDRRRLHDYEPVMEPRSFFKKLKKFGKKFGKIAGKVVHVTEKVGGVATKIASGASKVAGIAEKVATTVGPLVAKRHDPSQRDISVSSGSSLSSLASRSMELDQEAAVFQRDMDMLPEGWIEERSMDSEFELAERNFNFDSDEDVE